MNKIVYICMYVPWVPSRSPSYPPSIASIHPARAADMRGRRRSTKIFARAGVYSCCFDRRGHLATRAHEPERLGVCALSLERLSTEHLGKGRSAIETWYSRYGAQDLSLILLVAKTRREVRGGSLWHNPNTSGGLVMPTLQILHAAFATCTNHNSHAQLHASS